MNILFIYPNEQPSNLSMPLSIASLSAVLKKSKHNTSIFDTTFFDTEKDFNKIRRSLEKRINEFKPKILAVSCRSLEFEFVSRLFESIDSLIKKRELFVVFGGPHASVAPSSIINKSFVNALCIGEGEGAFLELVNHLDKKRDISKIKNLWIKKGKKIIKNDVRPFIQNLDKLPYPDYEIFDSRHISYPHPLKKMKNANVGCFELSRGCPYSCTYCINQFLQKIYRNKGCYHRTKSIERCIKEIGEYKKRYNLEICYFVDETFVIDEERLERFCRLYQKKIALPFTAMARPELINEKKMRLIKNAGCYEISIGIEEGNEEFRKKILNRHMSNEQIISAFKAAKKAGLKTESFNMVGLPYETRRDVFKTIEINRLAKPDSIQATIFYPFEGTKLREVCEKEGFIKDYGKIKSYHASGTIDMPQFSRSQIEGIKRTFVLYCKSLKVFWPFISILEKDNFVSKKISRVIEILMNYRLGIFNVILKRMMNKR